jgi:adenylate cyclase
MSEVFISHARSAKAQARQIAGALRALGYTVWLDDELSPHRDYTEELEEHLRAAQAVVVVWTAEAVKSQWVRAEANVAREAGVLVQLSLDGSKLPLPFDQIQCADLAGWTGDPAHDGWKKVLASVAKLAGQAAVAPAPAQASPPAPSPIPRQFTLPDKPSIAVLPFDDPAGAADGDYFADGMADEIVTALAKYPDLFITGSSSSLSYRGRERDLAEIGRQLGVRYLLEGAVRRSGQKVRISANLIEAASGMQIWADRFEGSLEDVFALQDEVANAVAARVEPSIHAADLRRGADRPTADQSAYDLYLRARRHYLDMDKAGWLAAKPLFEQVVARDPAFARAWASLSQGEVLAAIWNWSDDPETCRRNAQEAMRRALALGAGDPMIMVITAVTSVLLGGDPRAGEAMAERALAINPGSVNIWNAAGALNGLAGHHELALERLEHALRLDPRSADRYGPMMNMGLSLAALERFDEALPWLEESLTLKPDIPATLYSLTMTYARLGRTDDAKAMLARAETVSPAKEYLRMARSWVVERLTPTLRSLGADV